jgi:hypothetical protein
MQIGDHSGSVGVLVPIKTARREVKGVLMFSDGVFRAIIGVPKQGKAGSVVSKFPAIVTACSPSEVLGERHSKLRQHGYSALEGKPQVTRDSWTVIHGF